MRRLVMWGVLAVLVVALWAAVRFLPWWGLALGLVGAIVVGRWLIMRRLRQLLVAPFRLKGAVLRGAQIEVHSAEPAVGPDAATSVAGAAPRRRVRFELTVTPVAGIHGPFSLWEPGELRLVSAESRMDPENPEDDDACSIEAVEVQHEGTFQPDEGWKLPGPQRLRLRVAVAPGVARLKLRYYFEEFGAIEVPSRPAAVVA